MEVDKKMMKRIWKWLVRKCDEYLDEEKFEEVWWDRGEFGIGIVKYVNGRVGIEIYVKGKCKCIKI